MTTKLLPNPRSWLAALPAPESLLHSADALDRAAAELRGQPGRVMLWRLVTAAVESYHGLQAHVPACTSPNGALQGIQRASPRLAGRVRAAWAEHDRARAALNALIIAAQARGDPGPHEVVAIRDTAAEAARLLRTHHDHVDVLVRESMPRELDEAS